MHSQYEKFSQSLLSLVKCKALYSGASQDAFKVITEEAAKVLEVERASIWLYSKDRSSMITVDLFEKTINSHSANTTIKESDYLAYFKALAEERIINADDAHKDKRTAEFSVGYLDVLGIGAMLDAPIRFAGDVIGVICLEHAGDTRAWSTGEITYASSLADLASHALEAQKRFNAETALEKSSVQYRSLLETIPDIIYERDADGLVTYVSSAFEEITGFTAQDGLGRAYMNETIADSSAHKRLQAKMKRQGFIKNEELPFFKKDGSVWWASISANQIKDEQGSVLRSIGILRDITTQKLAQDKLHYQATHDSLTNLINRSEFERRIGLVIDKVKHSNDSSSHAMCFVDIDQYKVINDTYGHVAGDELLCNLGALLKQTLRKSDTLARLGGDEFGVLLKHCTLHKAQQIAHQILDTVSGFQFYWKAELYKVTVSIGIVAITKQSEDFFDLFRQVNSACYIAKEAGRNRIHTYHANDVEAANRRMEMSMVSRINLALDEDRFCLYAQEIFPFDGSEPRHFELLVRMLNEQGQIIPPGDFLPSAERYNLIEKLDSWVVKNACTFIANNSAILNKTDLFTINLSGPSLSSDTFYDTVIQIFNDTGVNPKKVCFEITETVAISNLDSAKHFITRLKEYGFRFALDDFGSGISSFGYLKNLPVDYLKIDGMFVKDMAEDPIDYAMVKSINEIGQVMGMKTIAEFVENNAIVEKLKCLGVNYGQGFGLARPIPLEKAFI